MKQRDLYYERIPTKLLREDIRLLGTFLGRVIKDQEGTKFFNIVERLRLLSKNTLLDKRDQVTAIYSTSNNPAAPMPPPTHMVHTTKRAPRRFPSIRAWPTIRAPDIP